MDVGTASILVSLAGIILWVITNWNTTRVGKGIKADIDAKRAETEAYVDSRLDKIEALVGGFEARMTAQLPPNVHGELDELKAEVEAAMGKMDEATAKIAAIDAGLGNWTAQMDGKFGQLFGREGASQAALAKMTAQAGADLEGAMQGSMQGIDTSNPMVRQFYVWATKPVDEKWASKHPFEAMLVQGGKMWFGQNVLPAMTEGQGSDMVRMSNVSKGDKIL